MYLYCTLKDPKFEEMLRQKDLEIKRRNEYRQEIAKMHENGDVDGVFEPDQEQLRLIAEEDSLYGAGASLDAGADESDTEESEVTSSEEYDAGNMLGDEEANEASRLVAAYLPNNSSGLRKRLG